MSKWKKPCRPCFRIPAVRAPFTAEREVVLQMLRAEYLHCGFLADFHVFIFGCVQEVVVDDNDCLCPFRVIILAFGSSSFILLPLCSCHAQEKSSCGQQQQG